MDKASGFDVSIVLPAVTNSTKFFKKIVSSLPKGSLVEVTPNAKTLQDESLSKENRLILNKD